MRKALADHPEAGAVFTQGKLRTWVVIGGKRELAGFGSESIVTSRFTARMVPRLTRHVRLVQNPSRMGSAIWRPLSKYLEKADLAK